ncbi:unnamed protein product [Microthlaspi erraticum]|uniref:Ubiquitin-like protease family profile domain-containing protein n=1 Tax=Microthlaspi erraticum TaxID=1685480 RepID=A0A6D2IVC7_9BRAS|nr:unnamed protein product [Microthlaspi erraticum]
MAKELTVSSNAGQDESDRLLVYVRDETFDELQQWSQFPEDLQVGPYMLTGELSKRVVGPAIWLQNKEIDSMMYLFREMTSLKRWNVEKVGFMSYNFSVQIKSEYAVFRSNRKQYQLNDILMASGKGELPSHGRTDLVWDTDVGCIYVPVSVSGNHWISLCINFVDRTVEVFDCAGMKKYREVEAFSVMVPCIVKEIQTISKKKQLTVAPYTIRLSLVDDDNIDEARYKVATDLLKAAKDEVLIERMSKYVAPEFTPSEVLDIYGF